MSRPFLSQVITDDSALGGSVIERSLRFNDGDTAYLERNVTSSSNRKTHTFSAWIKRCEFGDYHLIYTQGDNAGNEQFYMFFNNSDQIEMQQYDYPTNQGRLITTQKFRDPSAWYHIVMRVDTTNSTADDRFRIYVNGEQVTSFGTRTNPSQNLDTWINDTTYNFRIGLTGSNGMKMNGYMAEINFVDGLSLDPSSFGYTESQTGLWRPKRYEGTYGTNGFHLDFSDNSSTSTLGIDKSPNGNDFTANNFSVSAGVGNDSVEDTPTNNWCVLNPLTKSNGTLSNGNLKFEPSGDNATIWSNFAVNTGKWYWEVIKNSGDMAIHLAQDARFNGFQPYNITTGMGALMYYSSSGTDGNRFRYNNSDNYAFPSGFGDDTNGTVYGFLLDFDNNTFKVRRNNNTSTEASFTMPAALTAKPLHIGYSVISTWPSGSFDYRFGQNGFNYTIPTGYKTINSKNLPPNVPSIIRPQKHFDTVIYTGNDSSQSITSLEFQPDLIWFKNRGGTSWHAWFDSVRGRAKGLASNVTNTEYTSSASNDLVSFDISGFTLGSNQNWGSVNGSSNNIVAWCWKAGGAAVTNNDGAIASSVSVNTEAGFSIVGFQPTAQGTAVTIGHGLGVTPDWIVVKSRGSSANWDVFHSSLGSSKKLYLNSNGDQIDSGAWGSTDPTSSVFSYNPGNQHNNNHIAYCWSEVPGYSKFGKYTGNGSSDGVFIHLGFRARWFMWKIASDDGGWGIIDTARDTFNVSGKQLGPDDNDPEASYTVLDITSTGIKMRNTFGDTNQNNDTHVYMAFAEQPGTTPFETFSNAR